MLWQAVFNWKEISCLPLLNAGFEAGKSETPNRQRTDCPCTNWQALKGKLISSAAMMMSSNEYIFCVTGLLWGESTGHWWIPFTKLGHWGGALMFSLICIWTNGWANNRDAGDLRCHCAHYDVTVMLTASIHCSFSTCDTCNYSEIYLFRIITENLSA